MGKKIKIWWSLWRHGVPAYSNAVLAVGCFGTGWYISDGESTMALSRSGAMATIIAIGFTLYNHDEALRQSEENASKNFQNTTKGLRLTGKQSQEKIDEKLRW